MDFGFDGSYGREIWLCVLSSPETSDFNLNIFYPYFILAYHFFLTSSFFFLFIILILNPNKQLLNSVFYGREIDEKMFSGVEYKLSERSTHLCQLAKFLLFHI